MIVESWEMIVTFRTVSIIYHFSSIIWLESWEMIVTFRTVSIIYHFSSIIWLESWEMIVAFRTVSIIYHFSSIIWLHSKGNTWQERVCEGKKGDMKTGETKYRIMLFISLIISIFIS